MRLAVRHQALHVLAGMTETYARWSQVVAIAETTRYTGARMAILSGEVARNFS